MPPPPLMSVRDLTIRFRTDEGLVTAVDNIAFDIWLAPWTITVIKSCFHCSVLI